jgi:thiamine pyrophosphate-dependent acetolactate synthase large subunit-like protein
VTERAGFAAQREPMLQVPTVAAHIAAAEEATALTAAIVDEVAANNAIFTADAHIYCAWVATYVVPMGRRRLRGPCDHGRNPALVLAIDAQIREPRRQVVALASPSSVQKFHGELLTIGAYQLPIKVVVFNMCTPLAGWAEPLPIRDSSAANAGLVDYAELAWDAGLCTRRVFRASDLYEAAGTVMGHDGPALLDMVIATPTRQRADPWRAGRFHEKDIGYQGDSGHDWPLGRCEPQLSEVTLSSMQSTSDSWGAEWVRDE